MTGEASTSKRSNAYDIFILVLTVLSLVIMVALFIPTLSAATTQLLTIYDNVICFVFLFDFALNMSRSSPKRDYFFKRRGWLDLLGSIPNFGLLKVTSLLRLARLSRVARISRLLRGRHKKELVEDVLRHRGQYAAFITLLAGFIVIVVCSVLVLQFESHAPDANITTGGEALWWAVVTITTVGYGDYFPVTMGGRLTAVFVMFAGLGIIGSLASMLAAILVSPKDEPGDEALDEAVPSPSDDALQTELVAIKEELAGLRSLMAACGGPPPGAT
ncbi:MAG TPA: ion transporter [Actinomycetota bacterium]|jgi:voltage-gated potassium channel